MSPAILAVGHWRKRGCNVGVAEVYGRAPMESPLAVEEIDEKGKHGGHRIELLCNAQIVGQEFLNKWNLIGSAMQWGMRKLMELVRNGP